MKIVCYKDKILKAINSVVKAVASKTTMPILEGILIQTNDNEIKLTTYDLEIGIEYIMDCEVEEQGSTVVNAIMFSEIIRKLPDTEIKIYLDATPEERARRRYLQNKENGIEMPYEEILESVKNRDFIDSTREIAPLKKADDAIYVDSSNMTIDEVVERIKKIISEKRK